MGHIRLGTLPRTRSWKEVVGMIADGSEVAAVADKAVNASDKAFECIQNDAGFSETVWLLTQLAVAAKSDQPQAHLESVGLKFSPQSSVADVAASIHETLDRKLAQLRQRSDFGEMAQNALVGAITQHLNDGLGALVSPTAAEVHASLAKLGRTGEFGQLSRSFFAHLSRDCLSYFLSKTLGAEIGTGRRFVTTAQVSEFEAALATHAFEAAEIVERYSREWLSKNRFEGQGRIERSQSDGFGWYAVKKIRSEMSARATPDGP